MSCAPCMNEQHKNHWKQLFCDISLICFFYWAKLQFPSKEQRKCFMLWVKSRQKATDRLWYDRHSRSVHWGSKCWACAQGHRKSRRCWSHTPEQTQPQHLFHWLTATANTEQNAKYLPSLHGYTGLSEKTLMTLSSVKGKQSDITPLTQYTGPSYTHIFQPGNLVTKMYIIATAKPKPPPKNNNPTTTTQNNNAKWSKIQISGPYFWVPLISVINLYTWDSFSL